MILRTFLTPPQVSIEPELDRRQNNLCSALNSKMRNDEKLTLLEWQNSATTSKNN